MTRSDTDWGPLQPLDDRAYAQPQRAAAPPRRTKAGLGRYGAIGALAIALLSKAKFILPALKFLKFGSLISMILTIGVYAVFFGWPYAVGIVALIFVHEMGHALALKRQGIPAGAPVFVPFMGAVIAMKGRPRDAWVEAYVGMGGPLIGTLGAALVMAVAFLTDSMLLFALASFGFMINAFNMLPLSPLDGGRILGAVNRGVWIVGLVGAVGLFLLIPSPILILVILLGAITIWSAWKRPTPGYYDIPLGKRVGMGAAYFALLALMVAGMVVVAPHLPDVEAMQMAALAGAHVLGGLLVDRLRAGGSTATS